MNENAPKLPDAVYFDPRDYAGPLRRFAAVAVDFVFLILVLQAGTLGMSFATFPQSQRSLKESDPVAFREAINQTQRKSQRALMWPWVGVALAYHCAMRRTRGGTLGYRIARARIVNTQGDTPTWRSLAVRTGVAFITAMPLLATYAKMFFSPRRQAFHDRIAGTWVVRRNAQPIGPAHESHEIKAAGPWFILLTDVEPVTDSDSVGAEQADTAATA